MKEPNTRNKQENKVMTIKISAGAGGGGGIGGIVFLGGALIAATLVSAFAFKRGKKRKQQSSTENDISYYQSDSTATSSEAISDQPNNNLELMMKSSKDHHAQVIKGLSFLIPADSSLTLAQKDPTPSGDATAEMVVTGIQPKEDDKAMLEISDKKVDPTNGVGKRGIVLSESTTLFDDSGIITISKEECSFPEMDEVAELEFELIQQLENYMYSDQETIWVDSSVLESGAFQSYGVKPEPECSLLSKPETPPVSVEAVKLLEQVSEANNAAPGYGDDMEVEEKQEVFGAMVQEMIVEDAVQVAEDEGIQIKFVDDQQTFENRDEVKEESESIDVVCDHNDNEVEKYKPEIQVIGEELEELEVIKVRKEDNGVEITCVDQVILEDTEQVELIGKEQEKEDDYAESYLEKCEDSSADAHTDHVAEEDNELISMSDTDHVAEEDNELIPMSDDQETLVHCDGEDNELIQTTDDQETLVHCDEEDNELIQTTDDQETLVHCDEEDNEFVQMTEDMELMNQIQVKDESDVKMIKENEEEVRGDVIANNFEDKLTKIALADDVLGILASGEKDNRSDSLIAEQVSSEPTVDESLLLDSGETPPFIEANNVGEVNEVSSIDQVLIEDNLPVLVQLTEVATKFVDVVEKTPQMESSDDGEDENSKTPQMESSDDGEDENSEEKGEESSEGTGDSSMESNFDAVWPAESIQIQEALLELDEMKTDIQTKEEEEGDPFSSNENDDVLGSDQNIDDDDDEEVDTTQHFVRELANKSKQGTIEPWKVKTLTWLILATVWCLCHWYFGFPFEKVSLITAVISIAIFFGFPSHVPAKLK